VLVQNPGTKTATAQLTYMTPDGPEDGPEVVLAPNTRQTVDVGLTVPDEWSVSTTVTSDAPVIAERAMYWHGADGTYRQAAHNSLGVWGIPGAPPEEPDETDEPADEPADEPDGPPLS
jgi:hypothetical protein